MTDDSIEHQPPQKTSPDLYKKAVKGGFWVIAIRVLAQLLSIARLLLFMRILKVDGMGLLAVALLLIDALNTFSNTGFNAALIQKKEDSQSYLSTAWTLGIIRGVLIYAILYFAAPIFLSFMTIPQAELSLTVSVIRALGLSVLISSFTNIAVVYFRKDLQFHKQFIFQTVPTLISITVSVILVLIYKNVWALVIGRLSAQVFSLVISYVMHSFRPKFSFELKKAAHLWRFGKWIFISTIIGFLLTEGDDFFVLAYMDAAALAVYRFAYKFSNIPATEITQVISQVSFPAYSKLQNDIPRLRDAFIKILKLSTCLAVPVAGLIFILTPEFVLLFPKEDWLAMIPVMQILAFFGLSRAIKSGIGTVYYAMGEPDIGTKQGIIKVIILALLIYPLTKTWGISGTAIAVLIVTISTIPLDIYYLNKLLQCRPRQLFTATAIPFASGIIMVLVVSLLKTFVFVDIGYVNFFLLGLIGTIVYLAVIYAFDASFNYGITAIVKEQLSVLKRKKEKTLNT